MWYLQIAEDLYTIQTSLHFEEFQSAAQTCYIALSVNNKTLLHFSPLFLYIVQNNNRYKSFKL